MLLPPFQKFHHISLPASEKSCLRQASPDFCFSALYRKKAVFFKGAPAFRLSLRGPLCISAGGASEPHCPPAPYAQGRPRPPGRPLLETPFAAFHSIYEDLIQISQTGGSDKFSFYIIIKYRTMDLPDFFPGAPIMPRGRPFPASRRRDCRKKDFFPTGQNM